MHFICLMPSLPSWDKKTATYYGNFSFISKIKLLSHLTKNMVPSQGYKSESPVGCLSETDTPCPT